MKQISALNKPLGVKQISRTKQWKHVHEIFWSEVNPHSERFLFLSPWESGIPSHERFKRLETTVAASEDWSMNIFCNPR